MPERSEPRFTLIESEKEMLSKIFTSTIEQLQVIEAQIIQDEKTLGRNTYAATIDKLIETIKRYILNGNNPNILTDIKEILYPHKDVLGVDWNVLANMSIVSSSKGQLDPMNGQLLYLYDYTPSRKRVKKNHSTTNSTTCQFLYTIKREGKSRTKQTERAQSCTCKLPTKIGRYNGEYCCGRITDYY